MERDTDIGGRSDRFPITQWSAILAARSRDEAQRARALEVLIAAYWKPVYKYIRVRWSKSNEDAKDLTQEFFARLVEKGFLDSYDPAKARLRTFLRTCVDALLANEKKAWKRRKRGGDFSFLSLDFDLAESELARSQLRAPASPDEFFEKEYVRSLFGLAVRDLRQGCESRGKSACFQVFERYELREGTERTSYQQLARELGVKVSDVTNHLAYARREFRRLVLERLRGMTASEEEFRREARALLGIEPA